MTLKSSNGPVEAIANDSRQNRRVRTPALATALCLLVVAILVSLFRWTLVEYLTPFLEPFLEIAVALAFCVSLIWSVVHLIRARKENPGVAMLPIAVNVATILVVMFVPFTALTTELNFRVHYRARMAVVSNVLDGKYEKMSQGGGGRGDLIALPAHLSYVSNGGDILRLHKRDATLVFFFDFRGILDSFSGFVYSSDDTPPQQGDFGGRFREIDRLRPNWFWATSTN